MIVLAIIKVANLSCIHPGEVFQSSEAYLEPNRKFGVKGFGKIADGLHLQKGSIVDVWLGFNYASELGYFSRT